MLLTDSLRRAERYAASMSGDPGVLAGAVTEYRLNELGIRHPVALFVDGVRQRLPHASDDNRIRPSHCSPRQLRERRGL